MRVGSWRMALCKIVEGALVGCAGGVEDVVESRVCSEFNNQDARKGE